MDQTQSHHMKLLRDIHEKMQQNIVNGVDIHINMEVLKSLNSNLKINWLVLNRAMEEREYEAYLNGILYTISNQTRSDQTRSEFNFGDDEIHGRGESFRGVYRGGYNGFRRGHRLEDDTVVDYNANAVEWHCPSCNKVNCLPRDKCRECGRPNPTPNPKGRGGYSAANRGGYQGGYLGTNRGGFMRGRAAYYGANRCGYQGGYLGANRGGFRRGRGGYRDGYLVANRGGFRRGMSGYSGANRGGYQYQWLVSICIRNIAQSHRHFMLFDNFIIRWIC
eukprot:895933_1